MIPGLVRPASFSFERRRLHEAALSVLTRFNTQGLPFVLLLRTFHYYWLSGGHPGRHGTHLIEDHIFSVCRQRHVGMVTIQAQNRASDILYVRKKNLPFRERIPGFLVDSTRWREAVRYLIERAELVISLLPIDSPSAVRELATLVRRKRTDRVVLIGKAGAIQYIDGVRVLKVADIVLDTEFGRPSDWSTARNRLHPASRPFLRVVNDNELCGDPIRGSTLDPARIAKSFALRDLIDRLEAIRRAPESRRLAWCRSGQFDHRFPINFNGVARGYQNLALQYGRGRFVLSAISCLERAALVATRTRDVRLAASCRLRQVLLLREVGDKRLARRLARAALQEGRATIDQIGRFVDPATLAEARTVLTIGRAEVFLQSGKTAAARRLLNGQLSTAPARNDPHQASTLLTELAWVLLNENDSVNALASAVKAVEAGRIAKVRLSIAKALTVQGLILSKMGEDELSAATLKKALAAFDNPDEDQWPAFMTLGAITQRRWQQTRDSRIAKATVDNYRAARKVAEKFGMLAEREKAEDAYLRLATGRVRLWLQGGRTERAKTFIKRKLSSARARNDQHSESALLTELAAAFKLEGKLRPALANSTRAVEAAEASGRRLDLAKALTVKGVVLYRMNDCTQAAAALQQALRNFEGRHEDQWLAFMTLGGIGEWLRQRNPSRKTDRTALRYYRAAQEVAQILDMEPEREQAEEAYSRLRQSSQDR